MATTLRDHRGFSLVEMLVVLFTLAILAAIALPSIRNVLDSMRLAQSAREVERELQTARLKAVSTNRRLRVRLNCPAAGFYRTVEFLGTIADTAANRCEEGVGAYPYPAPDRDPLTVPNFDGPRRMLYPGATVGNATLEFRPDGTAWTVDAAGVAQAIPLAGAQITVTRTGRTKAINVNALGKIQMQ